jgi:hypothetical protein
VMMANILKIFTFLRWRLSGRLNFQRSDRQIAARRRRIKMCGAVSQLSHWVHASLAVVTVDGYT